VTFLKLALFLFWSFSAVFGTALAAIRYALGIQYTSNDMVTNARQILNASSTDHNNGMFLKIMPFSRDIADDFSAVR
jgi:hypothetical protein